MARELNPRRQASARDMCALARATVDGPKNVSQPSQVARCGVPRRRTVPFGLCAPLGALAITRNLLCVKTGNGCFALGSTFSLRGLDG